MKKGEKQDVFLFIFSPFKKFSMTEISAGN